MDNELDADFREPSGKVVASHKNQRPKLGVFLLAEGASQEPDFGMLNGRWWLVGHEPFPLAHRSVAT